MHVGMASQVKSSKSVDSYYIDYNKALQTVAWLVSAMLCCDLVSTLF